MDKNKDYLSILKESLERKIVILDEILNLNNMQKDVVSEENMDENKFNAIIEKKDGYIKEIEKLDGGFEMVYNHVKEILLNDTASYAEEIFQMKQMISEITEKSMEVQLSEKRNEQLVYAKFSDTRRKMHQSKVANQVAADYYKNMSKSNTIEPQFLDKKK